MTQARFELNDYSIRVLDVVKGKYGLKNRNEAINKFIEDFGEKFVEPEFSDDYLNELDNILREHKAKYGERKMSLKELDELLGLDK